MDEKKKPKTEMQEAIVSEIALFIEENREEILRRAKKKLIRNKPEKKEA